MSYRSAINSLGVASEIQNTEKEQIQTSCGYLVASNYSLLTLSPFFSDLTVKEHEKYGLNGKEPFSLSHQAPIEIWHLGHSKLAENTKHVNQV